MSDDRTGLEVALGQADQIAEWASRAIRTKFVAGQAEHGGNLFRKPVLKEIRDEAIDMITYLHVLTAQAGEALSKLDHACHRYTVPHEVHEARNILRFGNAEGALEAHR